VPDWVHEHLHDLPETMQESGRRAHQYEAEVLDLVEAATLRNRVGDTFTGVVLEADRNDPAKGDLMVRDPAVEARVRAASGHLPVGEDVRVRLTEADPATRVVRFEV
jgi:exoribonuclease R